MKFGFFVLAGMLAFGVLPATAQVAQESCSYDPGTLEVLAVMDPGGEATLQVVGGQILFGAVPEPCGEATSTNTDTIRIAGHAGSGERLVLDERTGLFEPGVELDTGAFREIEIVATLGDAGDTLVVYLTEGADRVAPGVNGIGLTADGDVDVTFVDENDDPLVPALPLTFYALGGDDYVNGRGEFGTGLAYLGPLTIDGGEGNEELVRGSWGADVLLGGPGDDLVDGQDEADVLNGGPGSDTLTAGGGNDRLIGGPGADTFVGNAGDDEIFAIDMEADTELNGGPGLLDTAHYDEGLDPEPLFVEIEAGNDETPPVVDCGEPDGLWHADDVVIQCTAEDPESLLSDPADEAFELTTSVLPGTETADAETETRLVCNWAGLCAEAVVGGNMVDKKAPGNPEGLRAVDHRVGSWSRDRTVSVVFDAASDGGSGVDGYAYAWTTSPTSAPDHSKDVEESVGALSSPPLADGAWYFHIATVDHVGNWSEPDHYGPYRIDRTSPRVRVLAASVPVGQQVRLRYRTADASGRTRERITVARSGSTVAAWRRPMGMASWASIQSVNWIPSRTGPYTFCVRAWDPAGNTARDCRRIG